MFSSSLSRSESVIDKNVLYFSDVFLFFGQLCGPAESLRTFSLFQLSIAMSGLKFSIFGPSLLILRSASNQSRPSLFRQSLFTLNILENILSNFPLEKDVINKISMRCKILSHSFTVSSLVKIRSQMSKYFAFVSFSQIGLTIVFNTTHSLGDLVNQCFVKTFCYFLNAIFPKMCCIVGQVETSSNGTKCLKIGEFCRLSNLSSIAHVILVIVCV